MKEHEKRFLDRTRAVRDACNALESSASRFESAVRHAWGTMDKSASEYGTRMAQTIEESARTLSARQASSSYEDTEAFHKESIEALNKIIKTVRRYVPKLRRGLRVELAALNASLSKLETSVRSLGLALDQSPGNRIELARRNIFHLQQVHAETLKLRTDETEANKALLANAVKEKETLANAEEYASNHAFQELDQYERSLSAKDDEIKQFLQPIIKPLTKLERIDSDRKNHSLDLATLRGLVDKPTETITTGQLFAVIQLMNQLDQALTMDGLGMEERRRRKAGETIEKARGALEELREDYLTIQANIQETLRQLKSTGLLDKKRGVEQSQAIISKEKENLTYQINEIRRRTDVAAKTLLREKQSIEQQVRQITGKEITIQTEQ
jgi:hypothetical protein